MTARALHREEVEVPVIPLALALACARTAPVPAVEAQPDPVDPNVFQAAVDRGQLPDLSREMNDHFLDALHLEMAVIGGNLEDARHAGAALAKFVEPTGLPDPSVAAAPLAALRAAAARAEAAADLPAAAAALGEVAQACGQCHTATGGGPRDEVPDPDLRETVMSLHLHGAYWMGYGLFAPNGDAWDSGVEAIAKSRMADPSIPGYANELHLHDIAAAARDAGAAERPQVWADLLLTCSQCHGTLNPANR